MSKRLELLAPAGNWDCARAAVENGADAIYFGLQTGFNARARADNFSLEELPQLMRFLHERQVKGYLTLNTLVFSAELAEAEATVRAAVGAGVDAILAQDWGLMRVIRSLSRQMAIHASTQASLTSAETIARVRELGIERVVLARELSVDEIRNVTSLTDVPVEVFVHGALCVAYSGQCLTSESLGGRSANRGQCAQACRLPYELICDGEFVDLGSQKYLLSPQDLAAYSLIPELLAAGVSAVKIEGRLKTPEYVASITHHYRQSIDAAIAGQPLEVSVSDREEMELTFSRGFSHGWLDGNDHKKLVPGRSSSKRGVLLGQIVAVGHDRIDVCLATAIRPGDGVVIEGDRTKGDEQGGRVYEVRLRSGSLEPIPGDVATLLFGHDTIDYSRVRVGLQIWKTDDPQLTARLRATYQSADPIRRVAVQFCVHARVGESLRILATVSGDWSAAVVSEAPLVAARTRPATREFFEKEMSRLGHTVFQLENLQAEIEGEPMVPLSVLSKLRQELVQGLLDRVGAADTFALPAESVLPDLRPVRSTSPPVQSAELHVLCRTLEQVAAVLDQPLHTIYADFQDIRDYREAVRLAAQSGRPIWLATPRIQKPGEMGIFRAMAKDCGTGWLVRNLSGIDFARSENIPFIADYSLNVANEISAAFIREMGAERITISYDLNRDQLSALLGECPPDWLEVVIHQHMPMFHMEHCVFCAVLSPGTNKTNCGRPCDHHQVELRDRVGAEHPLIADVGCRNTLFNATPQSAAAVVNEVVDFGVRNFRVELLRESGLEASRTVTLYRDLLAGKIDPDSVTRDLKAMNRVGVTSGTLETDRDPLAIL